MFFVRCQDVNKKLHGPTKAVGVAKKSDKWTRIFTT